MPDVIAPECRVISNNARKFNMLYAAMVFLSLHWSIVLYINSSFLEQYVTNSRIGLIYAFSAVLTVIFFLGISKVLKRTNKHSLIVTLSVVEIIALVGLVASHSLPLIMVLFIVHQTIVPLILFNLDIYMEELIGSKESSTGARRGLLLTIMSMTGAAGALASGYLLGESVPNFTLVYISSALLLLPFIFIMATQFSPKKYTELPIRMSLHILIRSWKEKDLRNVFGTHFLLQMFFTWMVIYVPLYLATEVGMSWIDIGQVLFVALLAYVFFEYPIGIMSDKWFGEKELMALGFLIIVISTSWFIFIQSTSIITWMIVLFIGRTGASLVETTTESYFFKHAKGNDIDLIGFFRATRPLSYVIGAGLGSVMLYLFDFNTIFVALAILMIPGFFFAMALHDTK